jgi:hypothetical protein
MRTLWKRAETGVRSPGHELVLLLDRTLVKYITEDSTMSEKLDD